MLFSRTFYNWENKKPSPLQWWNTSCWPFWNATQPILFGNYLSKKHLILTTVPSSWQERMVSFHSIESLCDRSKVKLLKVFCLFTFFFFKEQPKCSFALFQVWNRRSDWGVIYHIGKSHSQIFCSSLIQNSPWPYEYHPKYSSLRNPSLEAHNPLVLQWLLWCCGSIWPLPPVSQGAFSCAEKTPQCMQWHSLFAVMFPAQISPTLMIGQVWRRGFSPAIRAWRRSVCVCSGSSAKSF